MGIARRAIALITTQLILALAVCAPADTASARATASATATAGAREPVGGPRLGGRGVIVNRATGVKAPPRLPASSYIVADADTGEVLAAKDPHGRYLPASTLKTLTSAALIPKLDRDTLIRPSRHTVEVEGTKVGMSTRWRYKVSDLFKALMMVSGNDAALALAQAAGGLEPTLAMMNAEARRLQAYDTLAGSPNGLDVDLGLSIRTQHTSSYDLALIMRQGLKLRDFREYVRTVQIRWPAPPTRKQRAAGRTVGGYPIYTHDRLLRPGPFRYPGMIGGKNGYTNAARQTFVGAARRDGHTIIVALMHSPQLWSYVRALLDWGFAARGRLQPVGTLVEPISTADGPQSKAPGTTRQVPVRGEDSGGWGPAAVSGVAGMVVLACGGLIFILMRHRRGALGGPGHGPRGREQR